MRSKPSRRSLVLSNARPPVSCASSPSPVRGSHGRLPADPADGPVLLCNDASLRRDEFAATDVKSFLLDFAQIAVKA